jgi:subtilisin family serine protease
MTWDPVNLRRAFPTALAAVGATLALSAPALGAQDISDPPAAPTTPATQYAPNRLIVEWKSGVTATERVAGRSDAETSAIRGLGSPRFQLVRPQAGQTLADAMAALRANPDVRVVTHDDYDVPMSTPNDPLFNQLWGLQNLGTAGIGGFTGTAVAGDDIKAPAAWDRTVGSPSIVVADLDTGYRFNHEDLASRAWTNPGETSNGSDDDGDGIVDDLHGADFVGPNSDSPSTPDGDPTDDDLLTGGHGVHTAGTIGAAGNNSVGITGVAQDIRIMPLRVCSNSPSSSPPAAKCPTSSQILAINYAGAHGARVANMSLGGLGSNNAVRDAFASNPNVLFVISAGNDAEDNDSTPHYPCNYDPTTSGISGAIDNIVCVAATDQADNLAGFSDWGATSVDLGAPGTEILSTFPDETLLNDDFQTNNFATNWSAGFARSNEAPLTSFGMTDSPGATPTASTTVTSTSTAFAVQAGEGECQLEGMRHVDVSDGSTFTYQFVRNNSVVDTFTPGTSPAPGMLPFSSAPTTGLGGGNVQIRFNYTSSGSPTASNGVWLDDLKFVCITPVSATTGYDFLQGTSMAAPHVTGSAALLFSLKPTATVSEVKQALLDGAAPDASLTGLTTTGGRLDVSHALDALTRPDTAIDSGPSGTTSSTAASFTFSSADSATFQCRLDGSGFSACTSPKGYTVGAGTHTFEVRALGPHGDPDLTPASRTWTVLAPVGPGGGSTTGGGGGTTGGGGGSLTTVKCKVPKLKGKTLSQARKALTKAHCALGKVTKPKKAKGKLVVKSSSPAAGRTVDAGTKVKLTLTKPKPKHKKHKH